MIKYYEYIEPYYGLVKAESLEQSNEFYEKIIADEPEMPIEISEKDALIAHINGYVEGEPVTIRELVEEFYESAPGVLLVDGSLL